MTLKSLLRPVKAVTSQIKKLSKKKSDPHMMAIPDYSPQRKHLPETVGPVESITRSAAKAEPYIVEPAVATVIQAPEVKPTSVVTEKHSVTPQEATEPVPMNLSASEKRKIYVEFASFHIAAMTVGAIKYLKLKRYIAKCFKDADIPFETLVISVIYLERATDRGFRLTPNNVEVAAASAMFLASKFIEDSVWSNEDFAVFARKPVKVLNTVELEILKSVGFNMYVDDVQYIQFLKKVNVLPSDHNDNATALSSSPLIVKESASGTTEVRTRSKATAVKLPPQPQPQPQPQTQTQTQPKASRQELPRSKSCRVIPSEPAVTMPLKQSHTEHKLTLSDRKDNAVCREAARALRVQTNVAAFQDPMLVARLAPMSA
eukprot:GFYU01000054.1.p1 GENE.GFYU01000054.1~~GFYU01000054.1.p1  ORF type:complete len:374 (+),score=97.03 GFYU01000054.1:93-1214(+)